MTIPRMRALEKVWETSPPATRSLSYLAQSKGLKLNHPTPKTQTGAAQEVFMAAAGLEV
jgi:hypothetical protein